MSRLKFLMAFLLLTPAAAAQECPRVEIMCPTEMLEQGTPMTFSAKVSGGNRGAQFTFNWTVSLGTIQSGQGTPLITVDTTGLGGANVKATVEVGGLPQSCAKSESCAAGVELPPIVCGMPFDQYSLELEFEDEKARLDNFAIALQDELSASGFILVSAGKLARPDVVKMRAKLAWSWLTNKRGIDPSRLILAYDGDTLDGAAPHGSTTLRIVPYDADFTFPGEIINPYEVGAAGNSVREDRR
ncbi:MAG TPA: hypothetical protein VJ715_00210 [Pyrinomonadaceae bacterium]|nr:hypothetical protein [Pyrinomonadaceae bacterium]